MTPVAAVTRTRASVLAALILCVLSALLLLSRAAPADATPADVFFSEYVEGSSTNKALEIFNGTGAPVNLFAGGYRIEMYFNGSTTVGMSISLLGTVADGDVYVVAPSNATAAGITSQADQTFGTSWFNGNDAVVLKKGGVVVDVIGQVGFNPGTEWGSGLTSTADNTLRRKASIQAGDPNGADTFDPSLEWDGFAQDTFDGLGSHTITTGGDAAPAVASTSPANGATEVAVNSDVTINFNEPVVAAAGWYAISCPASGVHSAAQSGGPQSYTLNPDVDFAEGETCTVTVDATKVTDLDADDPPDQMASNHVFSFTTTLPVMQIAQVQGAAHISPFNGQQVKVEGVVTQLRLVSGRGYYLQDPTPDADDATSEAIFVFTSVVPTVAVGDSIRVRGTVAEFRPGGSGGLNNLTTTEIVSPTATLLSPGNPLPAPTVIGSGGRTPPTMVIEDDSTATGNVETSGVFDPAQDGIDFYESLESMVVQLNNAVAVGPTSRFGEIPVLGDNGAGAAVRTNRGGIVIRSSDFNPERIILDDTLRSVPVVNVADHFDPAVVGVMDYSFGNFKLDVTVPLARVDGGLTKEVTTPQVDQELAVATFNVENLDPGDPPSKFQALAQIIVQNLRSPDLIAVEEVQDNDGAAGGTASTVTDASVTWNMLISAIQSAGGPAYQHRQIDPVDDAEGGEPGGNIRVGFLFRTDRDLKFIDRPGGGPTTATGVVPGPNGNLQLTLSPGRVDPNNTAWSNPEGVRRSLAGEFKFRGKTFFAIANHWKSKNGDQPLFGRFQPPNRVTETQRNAGAAVITDFVDAILAIDPNANVIVLGDLNDFEFSDAVTILEGGGTMNALMETLPQSERYSFVFEGNSQTLDHIVVSDNLRFHFPFAYDIVHVNSEFAVQASDHEPQVARFRLTGRPTPK